MSLSRRLRRGKRRRQLPPPSVGRTASADRGRRAGGPVVARGALALFALAVGEASLLAWYDDRGEASQWLTHLLVGAVVGLLGLSYWLQARGLAPRPKAGVPAVVVVVAAAQLLGTTPDLLERRGMRQGRWMDVFLGSVSAHYAPAGNLTWGALSVAALAAYATTLRAVRLTPAPRGRRSRPPDEPNR